MKRSDITDRMVCEAYYQADVIRKSEDGAHVTWPEHVLMVRTGLPEKVIYAAMERACDNGLIDYGVSLRSGWLTNKGKALLATEDKGGE